MRIVDSGLMILTQFSRSQLPRAVIIFIGTALLGRNESSKSKGLSIASTEIGEQTHLWV